MEIDENALGKIIEQPKDESRVSKTNKAGKKPTLADIRDDLLDGLIFVVTG